MNKPTLRMLSGLLILTLLSGCGGTETPPETTSVNQAMLIEQSLQEQTAYTFPSRFTGDWETQEGRLTIHADAQVVAEQGVALPTATVTPRTFDQADVDSLLTVFLKGAPMYERVLTKDDYQKVIDQIMDPDWQSDPDAPPKDRDELLAYYEKELENAPEEAPIIHGFSDSSDPEQINGEATVDGVQWYVSIDNRAERLAPEVWIRREEYLNGIPATVFDVSQTEETNLPNAEAAIAQADALIESLGLTNMVCDDVQPASGTLMLRYVPTVNGIRLSSIREEHYNMDGSYHYQYLDYSCSEETNPDTVSWNMESIQVFVDQEGVCCFRWNSPTSEPSVKAAQSALLPFDEIVSIADAMLPVVVTGPTADSRSLVEIDRINGETSYVDVQITKVSLTLMRIRDKGSLQGTIVPVWDFWGTREWYFDEEKVASQVDYTVEPLLTLNAIDGTVVSRLFGY